MQVKQIYGIINNVTSEILGKTDLVQEDLSNIVDVGTEIFDNTSVDNYVKSLINHVGKVVFVNRPYSGVAPSVLMDAWEFGSVLEKISADLPDATENASWELENGQSYDPNIFYKPTVSAKFFNDRVTFEVPVSITDRQVKESFSNAEQLNGFISMIYTSIDKSMTVKLDALVMRTINAMIGETVANDIPNGEYSQNSTTRAVNVLKLYNDKFNKTLTADKALTDPDFIKYASYTMGIYTKRLGRLSTLFNVGGKDRFTPTDMLHFILLTDFASAANVYLQSDTFHDEFTRLPQAEEVPYWQGSGDNYGFSDISSINIKLASDNTKSVNLSGIIGVMFDRDALGVANMNRRTTTNYNPKAEFTNNWYKMDAGYFLDTNENFVVFYVA